MPPRIPKPPMSADPKLYHLTPPNKFWSKVRDTFTINPGISSGLPLAYKNRTPAPGSRPETYAVPATAASDVAFNPYYKRDTRRAYPALSTITQSHVTSLLLASPAGKAAISGPESTSIVEATSEANLPSVIARIYEADKVKMFDDKTGKLPPKPPGKRWTSKPSENAPHGEFDYWPMKLVH